MKLVVYEFSCDLLFKEKFQKYLNVLKRFFKRKVILIYKKVNSKVKV
nr:MAG TPA: hypothetical protein [Caudoviricetes sp.]